jgi:putative glutamine amidotransferase
MSLSIGLSACFFHRDPTRPIFKNKTLLYWEESLSHWLLSEGAKAWMMPRLPAHSPLRLEDLVSDLDGLVLPGGSDVAPESYGESALRAEWAGDRQRDLYEMDLVREFMKQNKPVLGICRGAQILNVALGGSLYQDINTQVPGSLIHRNWEIYEHNTHAVVVEPKSLLATLHGGLRTAKVSSIHHQAVKTLAPKLIVEARSELDDIIEAFRYDGDPFVYAVQWHPEYHNPEDLSLLDGRPLLREFLRVAAASRC